MKIRISLLICFIAASGLISPRVYSQDQAKKLENPVTAEYIKSKMKKSSPRLILTPEIENNLKSRLKSDPVVSNYYASMKLGAKEILTKPLLTYNVIGRRLLDVSREMLKRMTILSMVYRIDKDPAVLKRIDAELRTVCNFQDWHPSHFLDVAEMTLAVSIAADWTGNALPKSTLELVRKSLIEKGINASFVKGNDSWVNASHNWNQVCNGGMIAAAIVIGDTDPALAAKTISRSLEGMPAALKQYSPSGIYPEGATYWDYGTSFSCVTSSMLESAFGSDFGIAAYPSFIESATVKILCTAPSGYYFNYADCGDREGSNGDIVLAWFAKQTGNPLYLQKEKFLKSAGASGLSRLAGAGLIWLSQFTPREGSSIPLIWKGDGPNPLVIFRSEENDARHFYFGGKGGRGNLNHGNLDAGTFVFELDGVRWAVDPGNQDYTELEQAGFDLWNQSQNSPRWTLLTKGNQGHSNLTVNDSRFKVDAYAGIVDFREAPDPEATIDLTSVYGNNLKSAKRRFLKDSDHSIVIEDNIITNDSTRTLTWAMMTRAEVIPVANGAILKQDGKQMNLRILTPEGVNVSTIMLDPAPLKLDKQIRNLKRIEIRIPAYTLTSNNGKIVVRLSAQEK
ncbi:MAG: heparinase II/III family protein [Methanosarcina sp.]